MAERTRLSVVKPGEEPRRPRRASESITSALDGDGRDVLAAMRLALAKKLDAGEVAGNAIAAAYKELREIDRQIRSLDAADEEERQRASGSQPGRRSFDSAAL